MDPWTGNAALPKTAVPREDMRVPLERTSDLARLDATIWRAREEGLAAVTFVIPDREAGPWLPAVLAGARRSRSARPPRILVSVEARVVGADGRLSLEAPPPGTDRLYVTLRALPDGGASRTPMELREEFEEGRTSALDIVRRTVDVLRAAVRSNPGVVLSRPFALLAAVGIPEDWVGRSALEALAEDAAGSGAALQVDEWERTPRADAVEAFARAGVPLLWGTGTRDAEGVGVYDYVRRLVSRVPGLMESTAAQRDEAMGGAR